MLLPKPGCAEGGHGAEQSLAGGAAGSGGAAGQEGWVVGSSLARWLACLQESILWDVLLGAQSGC